MTFPTKFSSAGLKTAVGLLLAVGLLALFFRGTDFRTIGESLSRARALLIAAAMAAMLLTYALRAIRWKILLAPLGSASLWNCFVTTVVGFAMNFLVPSGRVGEIVRPYLLARKEGFQTSSAFATILVERIFDLAAVVLLVVGWLLLRRPSEMSVDALSALELGGFLGLGCTIAGFAVLVVFARNPHIAPRVTRRAFFFLPKRWRMAASAFSETFAKGLGVVGEPGKFFAALAMSMAVWFTIALGFWLGARSLEVSFPYTDTFPVIGFLTLGVLVPTPGAVGGYHYMCALALTTLFGTEDADAKAVALANHAIAFLPVTILGILLLPKAGMRFGEIKNMGASKPEDSESSKQGDSEP